MIPPHLIETPEEMAERLGCTVEELDALIDTSEVPELDAVFFENAVLTEPGEDLIDSLREADEERFDAPSNDWKPR